MGNTPQSGVYVALAALAAVRKRLESWYKSFATTVPLITPFNVTESGGQSRVSFPNLTVANSITFYWSFWIICTMNIAHLCSGHKQPCRIQPNVSLDRPPSDKTTTDIQEALQMAKKVFQGVHFFLQDDMKLFGANSATLPLRVAYDCITAFGNQDDLAECDTVLRDMSSNGYQYLVDFTKGGRTASELRNHPTRHHQSLSAGHR